jgi:uncharacterized protein DUF4124
MRRISSSIHATGRAAVPLLFLAALAAAGLAWWYLAPETMPSWLTRPILSAQREGPTLYKWRDEKGRLHVTDKPPADRPYETVRYDPDTNVVPGDASKH